MGFNGFRETVSGTRHSNELRETKTPITYYEQVLPDYTIKQYSENIYSVIKFHRRNAPLVIRPEEKKVNDNKLDNSFSRARSMILQYGLCNPWEYFVTMTLDKDKYNRYDLDNFRKDLSQFIRDMRKKYKDREGYSDRLSVLLVPEKHKDGAWHMHGLLHGIDKPILTDFVPGVHPQKLIDKGFLNWPDYFDKFGFVSCGKIKDSVSAVLYTTKYINKDVPSLSDMKGQHLYFHSRPLRTAVSAGDIYGYDNRLDAVLTYHGQFCSTGMVFDKDWTYGSEFNIDVPTLDIKKYQDLEEFESLDPDYVYDNISIFDGGV